MVAARFGEINMTCINRISVTLLFGMVLVGAGTACTDSNPAYFKYKSEQSIYPSSGGTSSAAGGSSAAPSTTAPGGGNAGGADADAGTSAGGLTATGGSKPYACAPTWTSDHNFCSITIGQEAVAKGISCVPADVQTCYKACGPDNSGYKSETCTGGVYAEQSDCSFDTKCDWGCFKLPKATPAECPTAAPKHGAACTISPCIVCGGTDLAQTTGYLDSKNSQKIGFCICLPPTASGGTQKWSCATQGTAWPCPGNTGC